MLQNFKHQIACITKQQCGKKLTNLYYSNTISLKYIFNVHQIPLQAENSTFSGKDTDKMHQNTPF